jgi:hypothetical protein
MGGLGMVQGVVRDATSGRPIAHAFIVLGWQTLLRVGETDAYGRYRIDDVPVTGDRPRAFGFAPGYVYIHGAPLVVRAGQITTYPFKMPRQSFPDAQLPRLCVSTIAPATLKPGQTATFSVHVPAKAGRCRKRSSRSVACSAMLCC